MYLREIGQVPLLSHEELEYAKRSYEGDEEASKKLIGIKFKIGCKVLLKSIQTEV